MNWSDLQAYKNNKVENYGMVPGVNSENKVDKSPPKKHSSRGDWFEKEKEWFGHYGFHWGINFHGSNPISQSVNFVPGEMKNIANQSQIYSPPS